MAKFSIKNTMDSTQTFLGVSILSGVSYEPVDQVSWAADPELVAALLRSYVNIVVGTIELSGRDGYYVLQTALGNNITTAPEPRPFSSKFIIVNGVKKNLFARNTGMQFAVDAGSNTLAYTATYAWAKVIGMELINGEALDTCQLKVLDSTAGTYSGVPNAVLNQYGYSLNIAAGFYMRTSPFDADLYVGMQLQFTYVSVSAKTVGLNIIQNEVRT